MKATGIIRRVDDLGRIVIPKEIRRSMGIREGEPMEIFIDCCDGVIFRKYEQNLIADVQDLQNKIDDHLEWGSQSKRARVANQFNQILAILAEEEDED